jgi:hypothetical protein
MEEDVPRARLVGEVSRQRFEKETTMNKPVQNKLSLKRETLRELTKTQLELVAGGARPEPGGGFYTLQARCTFLICP